MYLIPEPKEVKKGSGNFCLAYDSWISVSSSCGQKLLMQADLFAKAVKEELGYAPLITRAEGQKGDIILRQEEAESESYELLIEEEQVVLTGDSAGIWHGLQTLRQIIEQNGALLPALRIKDAPDLPNRGYYHDVTRGRVPKLSFLKKWVDLLAYYKINQLQLYIEHTFLFRDFSEIWRDDTPLTAEEIIELDRYCLDRNIELVPSLSSFGHLYKILSSKQYAHLCELEGAEQMPFSLRGRMHHHTINATDPESLTFIKAKIGEFMELFTSRQFNICADETFDLGKGKSKAAAEERGLKWIYIDYVKSLCEFLIEHGRRPMFWGDVLWGFPEMVKELPKEAVCLNWGYAKFQREEETKGIHEAGATQYTCPGVCGWNQLLPLIGNSYENIKRMCTYAMKYQAIGVLNTDWGDFLHINHPEFSLTGIIYGAAFSWNTKIPEYEEINRAISRLAFRDPSEQFVGLIASVQENQSFDWELMIRFRELGVIKEFEEDHKNYIAGHLEVMAGVETKNQKLSQIETKLLELSGKMDREARARLTPYLIALRGVKLFAELGMVVTSRNYGKTYEYLPDAWELAEKLEIWLYHYKEMYRKISKESELYQIQEIIVWYADYLRG